MDCEEELRWYEQAWKKDKQRWEEEKRTLEGRLKEQAAEILELKSSLGKQESQVREKFQSLLEACERRLEEQRSARESCERALEQIKRQLETLSRPALGEGFFRYLAQALELWDQVLIEEARKLSGSRLEPWLKAIWAEREEALSRALGGETPDWRRVRTGLVLEWALLTWLEGVRDG